MAAGARAAPRARRAPRSPGEPGEPAGRRERRGLVGHRRRMRPVRGHAGPRPCLVPRRTGPGERGRRRRRGRPHDPAPLPGRRARPGQRAGPAARPAGDRVPVRGLGYLPRPVGHREPGVPRHRLPGPAADGPRARRRAPRQGRAGPGCRPARRAALRRHAAEAGRDRRHAAPPGPADPRRTNHRGGPGQPVGPVVADRPRGRRRGRGGAGDQLSRRGRTGPGRAGPRRGRRAGQRDAGADRGRDAGHADGDGHPARRGGGAARLAPGGPLAGLGSRQRPRRRPRRGARQQRRRGPARPPGRGHRRVPRQGAGPRPRGTGVPMTELPAQAVAVTRAFGHFVAVDQVDLEVHPGEVVGLLGANGAGKTTLIRLLLGLLRPTGGEIRLFGEPPSRGTRRRIGYVPQGLGLYDDLTPDENMEFSAAAFGGKRSALPAALRPYAGTPVGSLPLGLQRRIAFAQALSHQPDLLILDEPTSGVDPLGRARLWDTIAGAAATGAGVLVTTHYMEEAGECGRLVIMADGRVVARGTAPEIVGTAQVTVVETASWAAAFGALAEAGMPVALAGRALRVPGSGPAEVRRALAAAGGTVAEQARVFAAPATLEERFFQLAQPGS